MAQEEVENQDEAIEEKTYDLSIIGDQVEMFKDKLDEEDIKSRINEHLKKILKDYELENYHVIFLYDEHKSISGFHSDKIYRAVSDLDNKKDILMFIESGGGQIEPAYLISKTCKRLAKSKFVISIPRRAKSAATLISLGATELHMGLLSQLGPIDPQFNGFPALGLANAVEKIAEMTAKHPTASDMFAQYLNANVSIRDLGYFERINESATQYAIRLLNGKTLPDSKTCEELADHFTNHYKDHGFVIDSDEASELLGSSVIKTATKEYEAGNAIYDFFNFLDFLYGIFKQKNMRFLVKLKMDWI
ncbi:SDH family Clp fold serine proteinase [Shewanella youngdeokensis]|uniref:ATP-dependent Clp protease proteolytic subunit n=1 Tax=Shewanella youngdeokensis TaxID=2999068 RepID=A0ABZ0K361_9GAMM|nr:ATP-dependent Clp protease proteolytic subunit [Shewanella sp. DAU334]